MDVQRIRNVVAVSSATIGFTMGLYLYIYGPIIIQGLQKSGQLVENKTPVAGVPYSLSPEAWALVCLVSLMLAIAVLEVPTGVLADVFGRKSATWVSFAFRVCFFLFYSACGWLGSSDQNENASLIVWLAITANLCLGIHTTLRSGSFNAWVRDWLAKLEQPEVYVAIQSRGKVIQIIFFAIGAFLSVFLYLHGFGFISLVAGALASLACMVFMVFYMQENNNTGYEFCGFGGIFTAKTKSVTIKATQILLDGLSYFSVNRRLWAIALLSTGAWSLFYFVDYYWVDFFSGSFPFLTRTPEGELPFGGSIAWVVLITVFSFVSGLTCMAFESRVSLSTRTKAGPLKEIGVKPVVTAAACAVVTLAYSLFLFLIWLCAFAIGDGSVGLFSGLVVLLVGFKAFDGVLEVCLDGLENVYISENEQARATILSTFSLIRNAIISAVSLWLLYQEHLFGQNGFAESIGRLWIGCCVAAALGGLAAYCSARYYAGKADEASTANPVP